MSESSPALAPAHDGGRSGRLRAALLWTAAIAAGGLALATSLQAFVFPLELELREGTAWLHVLAQRAGVSLYDHGRVAFVNMNHGPLDPLLKHWVSALAPVLTPAMVTRVFVLALPLALLLAAVRATNGNRPAALAWAGGLHLLLLGLQPPHFLVGRSDPTAVFFLALMWWNAAGGVTEKAPAGASTLGRQVVTGMLGGVVILTNWRTFPAVGAVAMGFLFESLASNPGRPRFEAAAALAFTIMLGALVPTALILIAVFHGDSELFYRHFFGFFSAASGWGTVRADTFALVPAAFWHEHGLTHAAAVGAVALGLVYPSRTLPRQLQVRIWLPLLGLLWLSTSVAYFLNHGGGGLHYYAPFHLLLALHLARAVSWPDLRPAALRYTLPALLFAGLPWRDVGRQCASLHGSFEAAHSFIAACREIAGGAPIYSEEYHLFKDSYGGEVVDMGDEVFAVSRSGYFGPVFTGTANRAFAALQQQPPAFVVTAGLASEPLQALLAAAYTPVLRIPYQSNYAGPAQTFYRRRNPAGSPATVP